jgi:homospermidine synthase
MRSLIKNIVVLGFGNIGQALSHVLRKHYSDVPIHVLDERMTAPQILIAEEFAFTHTKLCVKRDNFKQELSSHVGKGTLVLNLATSISSHDMIEWAQSQGAYYLDTCIDPWEYADGEIDSADNTNYHMRQEVINLKQRQCGISLPTAIVAHGANPGFVSILVKQALVEMQSRFLPEHVVPASQAGWAELAEQLQIRAIQVSERDTQSTSVPRAEGEFVNSWSVAGFVAEALQPVELGWGTHEASGPFAALAKHHAVGCKSAVFLSQIGAAANIKTWTPAAGEFTGKLISHNEAISLASYLSVKDDSGVRYRPTVYYAYHPCDQAMESLALLNDGTRNAIASERVLKDEIDGGIDELGVLLLSEKYPSLWLGSQLSIEKARAMAPYNNATSLQVVGSIMAALAWLHENPRAGIVESEELEHSSVFENARPYWEPILMKFKEWHPNPQSGNDRVWTIDQFLSF